ncbi:hypothetical protein SAMN05216191_11617 [Paenibacillus jilunlii]|uniref:Uncharacterized protein n=1 Tax=Paenibacillus jilunlii TaxID=682956 RepID=A0A1G9V484_9BACL|nr:hypothetical protein SAMN05216191_11617 [Paenibacillus jilunlii]
MLDIYMIAALIILTLLMVGLGQWASRTIDKGSDQG